MNKVSLLILFSFFISNSKAQGIVQSSPFTIGTSIQIKSKILSENRTLNIYLPEGYAANDSITYPVIYLLDGSADEDFIHIAGLMQFANFSWVNLWPPSILVGIANVDRKRDFTYPTSIEKDKTAYPTTGGSEKFISFLEKEVQIFIDANYRTNSDKTIIGQSLGGLLATEVLFKKPALFDTYIIISPSLWWDNESLLKVDTPIMKADFKQKKRIFIGVGNEEKIMVKDTKSLTALLNKSESLSLKVNFQYFPDKDHGTILHQAVYKAFEVLK